MDAISNMLTSLQNGLRMRKDKVSIPFSNLKFEIAKILKEKKLIREVKKKDDLLIIKLKFENNSSPIKYIKRISKPSQRIYVSYSEIPKVRNGLGFVIISTSKGVLDGGKAKKEKVGGELICKVW